MKFGCSQSDWQQCWQLTLTLLRNGLETWKNTYYYIYLYLINCFILFNSTPRHLSKSFPHFDTGPPDRWHWQSTILPWFSVGPLSQDGIVDTKMTFDSFRLGDLELNLRLPLVLGKGDNPRYSFISVCATCPRCPKNKNAEANKLFTSCQRGKNGQTTVYTAFLITAKASVSIKS